MSSTVAQHAAQLPGVNALQDQVQQLVFAGLGGLFVRPIGVTRAVVCLDCARPLLQPQGRVALREKKAAP